MLGIATGLDLESIAAALEISRRTLGRIFAHELATGRAKKLLASVVRLDKLAASGNVAAAKFLHGLMDHSNKAEAIGDDKWAAIADTLDEANLPKNPDLGKLN